MCVCNDDKSICCCLQIDFSVLFTTVFVNSGLWQQNVYWLILVFCCFVLMLFFLGVMIQYIWITHMDMPFARNYHVTADCTTIIDSS